MSAPQTFNPTQTLANDSRAQLEPWLEEFETYARNLCAQHDATGALTLVASDLVWQSIPANQTSTVRIAAGDPPFRDRPTWDQPAPHANNAAAAVLSVFKMETHRYADYSAACSTLNTALLASVGEKNRNHLKTTFPALKLYMLSPREIVDTMRTKHGVATSDDVTKLRDPLSRALTSLSDLTDHMDSFLLASQRLTRSGQGETDYKYFELFLETVSGFPSVPASMAGYYTTYPAILQQSLATLFPYLENLKDHLTRGDPSSPFSGAAKALKTPRNRQPRSRPNNNNNRTKQQQPANAPAPYRPSMPNPPTTQRSRWGPQGQIALLASSSGPEQAEIARLQAVIATMAGSPAQHAYAGMLSPTDPYSHASLSSSARPRQFYCWLHGYNNTHEGATCNVMRSNPEYTAYQKSAASPDGTGGNPNVGVPVSFTRPRSKFFVPLSRACLPCLPSSLHNSHPPHNSQAIKDSPSTSPDDAVRADAPIKLSASLMLQAEGLNPQAPRVRVLAPPKPLHLSHPKLPPALPPSPLQPSRFAHPNPFQPLSNDTFPPDPSHPSEFVSPILS